MLTNISFIEHLAFDETLVVGISTDRLTRPDHIISEPGRVLIKIGKEREKVYPVSFCPPSSLSLCQVDGEVETRFIFPLPPQATKREPRQCFTSTLLI